MQRLPSPSLPRGTFVGLSLHGEESVASPRTSVWEANRVTLTFKFYFPGKGGNRASKRRQIEPGLHFRPGNVFFSRFIIYLYSFARKYFVDSDLRALVDSVFFTVFYLLHSEIAKITVVC